jgi:hypothetical protein
MMAKYDTANTFYKIPKLHRWLNILHVSGKFISPDTNLNYAWFEDIFFSLLQSWVTQNFITIKTSWNTNDYFVSILIYYNN